MSSIPVELCIMSQGGEICIYEKCPVFEKNCRSESDRRDNSKSKQPKS